MTDDPGPTILDGGLATELEARGHDLSDRLWSARVLLEDPAAIEAVHRAYFEAGADVATTASYQATLPGLEAAGLDRAAALGVIRRSVELARRARDEVAADGAGRSLLVAGSVGPYGAMLADGSEYRGDYDPGPAALRSVHGPRIDALLEAGVDLLALETIPTMREAEVLVDLVAETGARAWLSYQCRDGGSTAAGESIADAVAVAADVCRDRGGRRQLHGTAARPRAAGRRPGRRTAAAPHRLPERGRCLGRESPAVDGSGRCRRVRR